MKKTKVILSAILVALSSFVAQAQGGYAFGEKEITLFDFPLNTRRLEAGLTFGEVGSTTEYARLGMGAYVLVGGVYVDFVHAQPQHKYDNHVSDTKWDDTSAFTINAGYQIPVLSWLRLMPLVGYTQTNYGVTDASTIEMDADETGTSWYHHYSVTPGSRTHYFNFGGGISIQPLKWVSIHFVYSRYAIYGGIGLDILSVAK